MDDEIEIGDHVTVGDGKVHWIVLSLNRFGKFDTARGLLRSGLTGRTYVAHVSRMKLHTKGSK